MSGWIKLHRQITENPLYFSERFTKIQAWIDILLECNHKANTVFIRGNEIQVKRGQSANSILTWSKRWKWNERTTKAYLMQLQNRGMIQYRTSTITTIITVVKFSDYQKSTEQSTEQNTQQSTEQSKNRIHTNKNVKNVKNVKKYIKTKGVLENSEKQKLFYEWIEYRKSIKKPITNEKTINSIIKRFESESVSSIKTAVNTSIENGWQGLFWGKGNNVPSKRTNIRKSDQYANL